MELPAQEFEPLVVAIVRRYCRQTQRPPPSDAQLTRFAAQLREQVCERGLPQPLRDGEVGAPGAMSEDECGAWVARIMTGLDEPGLAEAAKQLVKACFYPEFTVCRDSYREVTRDGSCRRQELARARTRISGTHCVDCPHWVALTPATHAEFLAKAWCHDPAEFRRDREIFLPEDFRALRGWLRTQARRATGAM
jgi:hypothetical protein